MRLGLIVILVGALYLLKNMGYFVGVQWSILWPTIVILIGIALTFRHSSHGRGCRCGWCGHDRWGRRGMSPASNTCDCDCEACKDCGGKDDGMKK